MNKIEPQNIYIVIGACGEYSDHNEWPVCWRTSKEEAQSIVDLLQKEAEDFENKYKDISYSDRLELTKNMIDAQFRYDYTGTSYHIWVVSDCLSTVPTYG